MLRLALSLSLPLAALGCKDAPPAPETPKPPVVEPAASAIPPAAAKKLEVTPGLQLKLLGRHLADAGIEVEGAPLLDAPAWAKPRAEPGAVVVADPKTGFELRLSQADFAAAAAHARELAKKGRATLHVDEAGALLLEQKGEKGELAVLVDARLGEAKLLCRGPGLPRREVADQVLAACRTLRLR